MCKTSFCVILLTVACFCQQISQDASAAIDKVVQGARMLELPEGKEMVAENTWGDLNPPIFTGSETLFENFFPTDAPNIQGFKRLVELSGSGNSDGLLTEYGKHLRDMDEKYGQEVDTLVPTKQRFLLIAYQDPTTAKWKIISVTPATDTTAEVERTKDYRASDKYSLEGVQPSLKRFWYALALINDGKLVQAKAELLSCLQMASSEKVAKPYKASAEQVELSLKQLNAILSKSEK